MEGYCEPIQIPMCQQMPYNATKMPNFLSNAHQSEAIIALEPFRYLAETACSPFLVIYVYFWEKLMENDTNRLMLGFFSVRHLHSNMHRRIAHSTGPDPALSTGLPKSQDQLRAVNEQVVQLSPLPNKYEYKIQIEFMTE